MFLDLRDQWPPPEPWKPERPRRKLTKREETAIAWIVCVNLLMLLFGPIAGATLFDAVAALFR